MKSLTIPILYFICLSIGFVSCNSDDQLLSSVDSHYSNLYEETETEEFSLNISYKNKDYITQATLINDTLVILNKDIQVLLDSIWANNANVQTLIRENGSVEYFDNSEELSASLKEKYKSVNFDNQTKAILPESQHNCNEGDYYSKYTAHAHLYFDLNYSGINLVPFVNPGGSSGWTYLDCDDNKISSIQLVVAPFYAAVLECYEDKYYNNYNENSANKLTLISGFGYPYSVPDLRKVYCSQGSKNWNDRISSFKFSVKNQFM